MYVRFSQEAVSHRRSSKPEDPLELEPYQRMEELAERSHRQFLAHNVFDGRRAAFLAEQVGMLPDTVGTALLLVHEPERRLPARDARPPAQRNSEQAEPVVDRGSFLQQDRLPGEYSKSEFGRGDELQVGGIG